MEEGKSNGTIRQYLRFIRDFQKWFEDTEGVFAPDQVAPMHLVEYKRFLENQTNRAEEPLSVSHINSCLFGIRTFYKYCKNKEIVSSDPTRKLKFKRIESSGVPKYLSALELSKFYEAIERENVYIPKKKDKPETDADNAKKEKLLKKKIRDTAICRMMSSAGLRIQEVADLNIIDITLEEPKEQVVVRKGKGDKTRTVPLNGDVITALEEWMPYRQEAPRASPLFTNKSEERFTERGIYNVVVGYAQRAGLADMSPHSLRHTFCRYLVEQGIPLEDIAKLAGHKSIETTRLYTTPGMMDLRKAVNKISETKRK
jgi:Site-specific recombinase XerD